MVTAKANTLLFEGWWRDDVVREEGARVGFNELFSAYCKAMVVPMGRQAFVARLNGLGVKEEKIRGVRYRLGIRLKQMPAEDDLAAPVLKASEGIRTVPMHGAQLSAIRDAAPMYRFASIAPGEPDAVAVVLEVVEPADEASARVAHELFGERVRQHRPVKGGGEGWDAGHDDSPHTSPGALQSAAAAYAFAAAQPDDCARFLELNTKLERPPLRRGWLVLDFLRAVWPWDVKWWKPKTDAPGWRRRCLVKAGGLIIAAIEKIDREDARGRLTEAEARQATGV